MINKIADNDINFCAKYRFRGSMPKNIKRIFRKEDILPDNYRVSIRVSRPKPWLDNGVLKQSNAVNVKVRKNNGDYVGGGFFCVINKNFLDMYMKVSNYLYSLKK